MQQFMKKPISLLVLLALLLSLAAGALWDWLD